MDTNTALVVMAIVAGGVLFVSSIINTIFIILLFQDRKEGNVRLALIEEYLKTLSEEVENQVGPDTPPEAMFHSMDGRYHGHTVQELLQQMSRDPNSGLPKDLDFTDPKVIEKFLQDINSEEEYNDDEDDEDSGDSWKGKK